MNKTETQDKIGLIDTPTFSGMLKWYDQQIQLAKKSKELSSLKAEIAKSKAEEQYAYAKLAEITAPAPQSPAPEVTSDKVDSDNQQAPAETTSADPSSVLAAVKD